MMLRWIPGRSLLTYLKAAVVAPTLILLCLALARQVVADPPIEQVVKLKVKVEVSKYPMPTPAYVDEEITWDLNASVDDPNFDRTETQIESEVWEWKIKAVKTRVFEKDTFQTDPIPFTSDPKEKNDKSKHFIVVQQKAKNEPAAQLLAIFHSLGQKEITLELTVTIIGIDLKDKKRKKWIGTGEAKARAWVVQLILLADTNRDGKIDLATDKADKDKWTYKRGAIFIVNYDGDRGNKTLLPGEMDLAAPDVLDFDKAGAPIAASETKKIADAFDLDDIAPLQTEKLGAELPAELKIDVFIRTDSPDQTKAMHFYDKHVVGAESKWGGLKTDPDHKLTDPVNTEADKAHQFGMEGLFLRNTGMLNPFAGEIMYTVELRMAGAVLEFQGKKRADKVILRVAPYMMLPNTQEAQKIYLSTDSGSRVFHDDVGADDLAKAFGEVAQRVHLVSGAVDPWYQDHVKVGFSEQPVRSNKKMHLTLQMPRDGGQDDWPRKLTPTVLLEPGAGIYRLPADLDHGNEPVFGGNLAIMPPATQYPLGRLIVGTTMKKAGGELYTFLESQEVQPIFEVDTDFLRVGHVDEIVGILPTGADAYKVALPSPKYFRTLLSTGDKRVPGLDTPPAESAGIFINKGGLEDNGQASNAVTLENTGYLFDGVTQGYIKCPAAKAIAAGDTIRINDGTLTKTFEFTLDGKVKAGNIAVVVMKTDLPGKVRDELINALGGQLDLNVVPDGKEGVLLFSKKIGGDGLKKITASNPAFMIQQMKGGKADGKNLGLRDWKYVRIYDGAGEGQVATVVEKGPGFLRLETIWKTTSQLVMDHRLGMDFTSLYYYIWGGGGGIPSSEKGWFVPPDATSKYLVVTDCRVWHDGDNSYPPALWSVHEYLKKDPAGVTFNEAVDQRIAGVKSKIQMEMGNGTDGKAALKDDAFLSLPVHFVGVLGDQGSIMNALAWNPGLANAQPVSARRIVFPEQFGPRIKVGLEMIDLLDKSVVLLVPKGQQVVRFANDWDHYHRNLGEIHCASEAKRAFFSFHWWEKAYMVKPLQGK